MELSRREFVMFLSLNSPRENDKILSRDLLSPMLNNAALNVHGNNNFANNFLHVLTGPYRCIAQRGKYSVKLTPTPDAWLTSYREGFIH